MLTLRMLFPLEGARTRYCLQSERSIVGHTL